MSSVLFDAPGPRTRRRIRLVNLAGALVLLAVLTWVVWGLARQGQFEPAKWTPFVGSSMWNHYLLVGLANTVRAAAIAIVTSLAFGIVFGLGRLAHLAPIRWVCTVIVEFFRAIPVLIMMIFFLSLFSAFDAVPSGDAPLVAVVVALTLYNGSVIAELVRSGVHNLPAGQREAAMAIGLTAGRSRRIIELPQALIAMMPSLVSQLVVILKDTALGSIITYPELLRSAERAATNWSNFIPAMIVTAAVFIVINYSLTRVAALVNRRLDRRTATSPEAGAEVERVRAADPA
ncbi:amino acid ABC transporter permease [Georgenia halophila]|uniref:Amino acid ABC transporter permease n=1 Tax=Georgenia halophila TaxID=620889 RepID=A0ABP8L6A8_9MICO